jgi:thioredoxin 1
MTVATLEAPPAKFERDRLRERGVVVVAFLADWCPFCRAFVPSLREAAERHRLPLRVADLTALDSPLWDRFSVEVVPTVIVFRDGRAVFRADGVDGQGLGTTELEAVVRAARTA